MRSELDCHSLSQQYGIPQAWWAAQPRITAKSGWITLDAGQRVDRQIAACTLGIAIVQTTSSTTGKLSFTPSPFCPCGLVWVAGRTRRLFPFTPDATPPTALCGLTLSSEPGRHAQTAAITLALGFSPGFPPSVPWHAVTCFARRFPCPLSSLPPTAFGI